MRRWRCVGVGFLLFLATSGDSLASDFVQECRPSGNRYAIEHDTLYAVADPNRRTIPYETLAETTLTERRGYCIAKGSRYEFQARTYRQRIRFTDDGNTVELLVLCEMASDGLPAGLSCEKEVVTHNNSGDATAATAAPAAGSSRWSHNGSVLRLETAGADRRFVYDVARPGMLVAGAKPGDPVFEGRREGRTYTGTAYVYTKACGRVGYPVTGTVAADDRSVVVEGQVPVHSSDCAVKSHRPERMEFILIER